MVYFCTQNDMPMNIRKLYSLIPDKRKVLVLIYIHSVADGGGRVGRAVYTMASDLGLHRQTLTRILKQLEAAGMITLSNETGHTLKMTPIMKMLLDDTKPSSETSGVTESVTDDVTESVTLSNSIQTDATACNTALCISSKTIDDSQSVTLDVTQGVTLDVQNDADKENKEESTPTPPKEEKKEKNHTSACARKRIPEKTMETRLQLFTDSLKEYVSRYGQEMVDHFTEYWTEPNRSNTKMRFELQHTWNTAMRLARWARNDYSFNKNNTNYATTRKTSAEYVADAQHRAITETECFIREAEIRRGGIPPHLPF